MKLGCGYPMGPFTLLDFVGLDTTYYIANIMFEEFREPAYAPPPLLKRMVLAGRLGQESPAAGSTPTQHTMTWPAARARQRHLRDLERCERPARSCAFSLASSSGSARRPAA